MIDEQVYGNDGGTYTIKVRHVGQAFATQSKIMKGPTQVWESPLFPYGAQPAAFQAAAAKLKELTGGFRYVSV